MKRRIFNILSALSLALCVATAVLWTKSFWKGNGIGYAIYSHTGPSSTDRLVWYVEIICGSLILDHEQLTLNRPEIDSGGFYIYSPQPRYAYVPNYPRRGLPNYLGFFIMSDPGSGGGTLTRLIIPCWFVALLSAVLPVVWVSHQWRAGRLHRAGFCLSCGYDLRASKERCPECGTAIQDGRVKTEDGRMNVKYEG